MLRSNSKQSGGIIWSVLKKKGCSGEDLQKMKVLRSDLRSEVETSIVVNRVFGLSCCS